jgi:hypothetical protein
MKKEQIISRLAFIKYLTKLATQKSKEPEPYCWVSILNYHDAVELFLELVAEELEVPKGSRELRFSGYWQDINPILKDNDKSELTQKLQMDKLNGVRVALKHHGTPPSKSSIEEARVNVPNFLEENTSAVFGMKFAELSLIDLVQCQSCKDSLKAAEQLLAENKDEDALDKIAIAFEELIDDYENRKRETWGNSPFFFGQDLSFAVYNNPFQSQDVLETVKRLQSAMKIISIGIDYRKYSQFMLFTSRRAWCSPDGTYEVHRRSRTTESPTKEDIEFCLDFVIESSIILTEFDFEVRPKKRPSLKDAF